MRDHLRTTVAGAAVVLAAVTLTISVLIVGVTPAGAHAAAGQLIT